jgi:CheY-like chemotaxis protein/nitrogen-specific signal transduction histidine kinase
VLIIGFLLSLLLFGLILGFRNKQVKSEKLALEQKTEQLRELDRFKSRFYTNITHEFRTPLTVIGGVSQQIQNHDKEKGLILRNCNRLLDTVNQLLDLSRLENKSHKVELVHGNIINFMEYMTESFLSLANQKNIHLAFFSTTEGLMMDYDETKMQQILQNLISNAIKFTPQFGVVKVFAEKTKKGSIDYLKVVIKDTGHGIAAEHLNHIYDRFYQADSSDTRHAEGSGIGLALVKELVTLLRGTIEVKSKLNKGTEFSILIPIINHPGTLKKASAREYVEAMEPDVDGADTLAQPENNDLPIVLIIEDNADVREYMISCIHTYYRTYSASDGKEGLQKALEIIPDVVISDVMMPEMDGFTVCRELKNSPPTSHIPIILITAKATQEDKVTGLEHGADAYLTKPFDKEELLARLKNMVGLSKRLKDALSSHDGPPIAYNVRQKIELSFLEKVNAIIVGNLQNAFFGTTKLCREIAMSRTQLHRKLKALTGHSTASYIRKTRLRRARQMIETTDMAIGQISTEVGFKDFSHFTRSFTKEYGQSPSETRK